MIEVPAYLVTDAASADLERWKAAHPDWFVAGRWGSGGGRGAVWATPIDVIPTGPAGEAEPPPGPSDDPSPLSVRDFMALAAAGRGPGRTRADGARLASAAREASSPAVDDDTAVRPGHRAAGPDPDGPDIVYRIGTGRLVAGGSDQFAGRGADGPPSDAIRSVEETIEATAEEVKNAVNPTIIKGMSPSQLGTHLHTLFAAAIRARVASGELPPTVYVEQSFANGRDRDYGEKGSHRTDVIMKSGDGLVAAIWDYKTGQDLICRRHGSIG